MVSNNYKLVLIVLCFFLALTFVRAAFVDVTTHNLALSNGVPVAYPLTITNSSNHSQHYTVEAWGPFTIEVSGGNDAATIPAHSYKTITVFASPAEGLEVGESYSGVLRVKSETDSQDIEINLSMNDAPYLGNTDNNSSNNGTGFVSFPSVSEGLVNLVLFIAIIVLIIALLARIKNRVVG